MRRDFSRWLLRAGVISAVAVSQGVFASAADAATVGEAHVNARDLLITAGEGHADQITIGFDDGGFTITTLFALTAGPGCSATNAASTTLVCTSNEVASVIVSGGDRNDQLTNTSHIKALMHGEAGNDVLRGGSNRDTMTGGPGADMFVGGGGIDTVSYSDVSEDVSADADGVGQDDGPANEHDTIAVDIEALVGGDGDDTLTGTAGDDSLQGGPGNDVIDGEAGKDFLRGGLGDDTLRGGAGDDRMLGDGGNDLLTGETGADDMDGGAGVDTVSYDGHTVPVTANLDGRDNDGAALEGDDIDTDVENLSGGSGNDTLIGDGRNNTLRGVGGDDTLLGEGGNDLLIGNTGNDIMNAGAGDDVLLGFQGDDDMKGEAGDDELRGDTGADKLAGGEGIDLVTYEGRTAAVSADPDNQIGDDGEAIEHDRIFSDVENLTGGNGNDVLIGNTSDNVLKGGPGNDLLNGKEGVNTLNGGTGEDTCLNGTAINC